MTAGEEIAASVGFALRTLLFRYDQVTTLEADWANDPNDDSKMDQVLMAQDATAASARRVVHFFVAIRPRAAGEVDSRAVLPDWTPPASAAAELLRLLQRLDPDFLALTEANLAGRMPEWPFALILGRLHEILDNFGWHLRFADPDAARHFDHNLTEFRQRFGTV